MEKPRLSPNSIFYPKTWTRVLAVLIAILAPVLWISVSQEWNGFPVWFIVLLSSLVFILGMNYAFRTRVIAQNDGLHVKGFPNQAARWDELSHIGSQYVLIIGMALWGIYYTKKSADGKGKTRFLVLGHVIERPPHKNVEMLVMPSGYDLEAFRQTEFGQILWEYAPQLFERVKYQDS